MAAVLQKYFGNPQRKIKDDPKLLDITSFRRYGHDSCFEFLAEFEMQGNKDIRKGWVKFKDLASNMDYMQFFMDRGFNMAVEQELYYEDIENVSGDEDDADDPKSDDEPIVVTVQNAGKPKKTKKAVTKSGRTMRRFPKKGNPDLQML